MVNYHFITEWIFRAPAERIWALVKEPESMVEWWPEIKQVKIRRANKDIAEGDIINVVLKGFLFKLQITLEVIGIKPKKELHLKSYGDLEGRGLLTLNEQGDFTKVRYSWEVNTIGWWINLLGLLFKPLLIWSHNKAMDSGYHALKSRIE
jgi:hypothetical protein